MGLGYLTSAPSSPQMSLMSTDANAVLTTPIPAEYVVTLTRGMTLLFAFAVSVMIVNLSAAQPLTAPIAHSLGIPPALSGLVATLPQLGYALGMVFLVPLADLTENRRLAVTTTFVCAVMLVLAGLAPNASVFLLAACVAGTTSCAWAFCFRAPSPARWQAILAGDRSMY